MSHPLLLSFFVGFHEDRRVWYSIQLTTRTSFKGSASSLQEAWNLLGHLGPYLDSCSLPNHPPNQFGWKQWLKIKGL